LKGTEFTVATSEHWSKTGKFRNNLLFINTLTGTIKEIDLRLSAVQQVKIDNLGINIVSGVANGGFVGGFTGGLLITGDMNQALNAGFKGMLTGVTIGGGLGAGSGYKYAVENHLNPLNGKALNSVEINSVGAKGISIKKLNDNYLKQQGLDAHSIKYEYLGKNAQISRFNLYETPSGQIFISDGKNVQIPTDYFIK
jgi:hypothetical protein